MSNKPKPLNKKNKPEAKTKAAENAAFIKELKAEFLRHYENGGALYWAAAKINRSVDTIGRWRTDDAQFDQDVLAAFDRSTDLLKMTAFQRALKGSDNLTMFLMKQRDPSYRDRFIVDGRHMHAGSISNPSRVPVSVQAAVDAIALDLVKKMAEKL